MTRFRPRLAVAVLGIAAVLTPAAKAEAQLTTYTSSSAFFAALFGPSVTETYESYVLNMLIPAGTTLNGITYSAFPAGTQGRIDNFYNRIGNQSLALSRPAAPGSNFFLPGESFTVTFAPAQAIGIFFNANPTPNNNDLFINTAVGTAATGGPASNYDTSTLFFAGLISSTPFTSATIGSDAVGSAFNVDNLTIAPVATVTPEPLSLLLLGTGLAGVAGLRRRKKEKPV